MARSMTDTEIGEMIARMRKRYAKHGAVGVADALDVADQLEALLDAIAAHQQRKPRC